MCERPCSQQPHYPQEPEAQTSIYRRWTSKTGGGGGEDCAATERYSALKRKETRWPGLNLVDILLREISQSQNCKNRVSPFLCGAWSSQIHGHGEQTESLLGLGQREEDCGMDVEFEIYKAVTFTLHVIFFFFTTIKKKKKSAADWQKVANC